MTKNIKTVNTIVMSSRIGIIVCAIADKLGISNMEALRDFYYSKTCRNFHNTSTGLYLYSNNYIVDEFMIEKGLIIDNIKYEY